MDPNATIESINSHLQTNDLEEADQAAQDLLEWLQGGGFRPLTATLSAEAARRYVSLACLLSDVPMAYLVWDLEHDRIDQATQNLAQAEAYAHYGAELHLWDQEQPDSYSSFDSPEDALDYFDDNYPDVEQIPLSIFPQPFLWKA